MATTRITALALVALALASPVCAQDGPKPLSSIDWLSDSVNLPQDAPALPQAQPPETQGERAPDVAVRSLDAPLPDAQGLLPADEVGLPDVVWGKVAGSEAARRVTVAPTDLPPAARQFMRDLLIAETDAPIDAAVDDGLYFARIDKLLDLGHLDDAQALLDKAPVVDPRVFRRLFDIALLRGTEGDACHTMEEDPDILPTFPARIFCLARNGEWDVAALTLGTAEALGYLTEEEDALLLKFLDPDLFMDTEVPPLASHPSPLVYRLYEAMGERLETETLPTAFAEADLRPTVGWRTRLRAAERLTGAGAMAPARFFEIVLQREPAASGGIWDRVGALQAAERALRAGRGVESTLAAGWRAAKDGGTAAAVASYWAPRLRTDGLSGPAQVAAFEIALMAGDADLAAFYAHDTEEDSDLAAIATGNVPQGPGTDPLSRAVRRGLAQAKPSERHLDDLEESGAGPLLLTALQLIAEGRGGDPDAVAEALTILRHFGLDSLARQIAVEMLLEDRSA